MKVARKRTVVWSSKRLFADLNPFFIETLYLLAQSIIDIGTADFPMLYKILFCKQARSILTGASSPETGYLWRIPQFPLPDWLFSYFLNPRPLLFHLLPIPYRSPRAGQLPNTGDRLKLLWGLSAPRFSAISRSSCLFLCSG